MKCATVAVIGRPSSGKSTLVNTICERKVSITSPTPQTTRNAIRGIYTDQRGQLILTDTPGYHVGTQEMNLRLQQTAVSSLKDSDAILYIVDPTRVAGTEEQLVATLIAQARRPVVVALNKEDLCTAGQLEASRAFVAAQLGEVPVLALSAKNDTGVDEVLIELFKVAPEGDLLYPEESFTDQPLEFRISEIIREKAIALVTDEIPHAIYVELEDLEHDDAGQSIWIRASVIVERETQKGIVVGKGGEGIKKIRQQAFKDIKKIFPGMQLQLDLRVKAQPKWRHNQVVLDRILR